MRLAEWRRLVEVYLRPHRRLVVVLGASLFVAIGLQVATPQVIRLFIDRAADRAAAPSARWRVSTSSPSSCNRRFGS